MKTIIRALLNQREIIEAGAAAVLLILGVVLAAELLAMAFASAQSVRPGQVTIYGSHSDAGEPARSLQRGGTILAYRVVF